MFSKKELKNFIKKDYTSNKKLKKKIAEYREHVSKNCNVEILKLWQKYCIMESHSEYLEENYEKLRNKPQVVLDEKELITQLKQKVINKQEKLKKQSKNAIEKVKDNYYIKHYLENIDALLNKLETS